MGRKLKIAALALGVLGTAATVAAGRTRVRQAELDLETAGWGSDDVRVRPGLVDRKPTLVATLPVDNNRFVKAAYQPRKGGWMPVTHHETDGTPRALPAAAQRPIGSRRELTTALSGGPLG